MTGEREEGFDRTMAEAYVRRALEFWRVTQTGFLGQCIGEISRGMFAFPNKSPEAARRSNSTSVMGIPSIRCSPMQCDRMLLN